MKLYLFNPEHDMALASFSPYYKAPTEIIRMRHDLSGLSAWYADLGDFVGVFSDDYIKVFGEQCVNGGVNPFGKLVSLDGFSSRLSDVSLAGVVPWGWDPALALDLSKLGVDTCLLPDGAALESVREVSGRQQCVRVLSDFKGMDGVCGEACVCDSLVDVHAFLASHEDVILKAPWSGSGRGLTRTSLETWTPNLEGWVARVLRTQGSIMAEPIYNKVEDFAMEFQVSSSHEVCFVGYSLFETDSHGNYKQNVLTSNERIVERLSQFVPVDRLEEVKSHLLVSLKKMINSDSQRKALADYVGYFGVDMMICDEAAAGAAPIYVIHPCVEINFRMNMGVVARLFFDRYMDVHSIGNYVVEHYNADGVAIEHDRELRAAYPSRVEEGKIVEGYFPLTPVTATTRYQCYVLCEALV